MEVLMELWKWTALRKQEASQNASEWWGIPGGNGWTTDPAMAQE